MKTLYQLTLLFVLTLTAKAADLKFSALPTATSPSTNSYIPIIDLNLLPAAQNQKYLLTNLATVAYVNGVSGGTSPFTNSAGVVTYAGGQAATNTFLLYGGTSIITNTFAALQILNDVIVTITNYNESFSDTASVALWARSDGLGSYGVSNVNMGAFIESDGAGVLSIGLRSEAWNSTTNIAIWGRVRYCPDNANIAGLFETSTVAEDTYPRENSVFENAVVLVDARDSGFPIFVGRTNNGTHVFSVENDGTVKLSGIQGGYTKVLTDASATSILYIPVANTNTIGGEVLYTINATDGTDTQEITGRIKFGAVAKTTTVTPTLADVQNAAAVSAGTLSATLASNVATNNVWALTVNADTSLTTTNLTINWRLESPKTLTVNAL